MPGNVTSAVFSAPHQRPLSPPRTASTSAGSPAATNTVAKAVRISGPFWVTSSSTPRNLCSFALPDQVWNSASQNPSRFMVWLCLKPVGIEPG